MEGGEPGAPHSCTGYRHKENQKHARERGGTLRQNECVCVCVCVRVYTCKSYTHSCVYALTWPPHHLTSSRRLPRAYNARACVCACANGYILGSRF